MTSSLAEVNSLTTTNRLPSRGEIWLVNLDPTIGAEIQKKRPAVVVSSDEIRRLRLKLVAPITGWKDWFASNLWHVQIEPTKTNGLTKLSAVDALQLRGVDEQRLIRRLGTLTPSSMEEIAAAIAIVVEFR